MLLPAPRLSSRHPWRAALTSSLPHLSSHSGQAHCAGQPPPQSRHAPVSQLQRCRKRAAGVGAVASPSASPVGLERERTELGGQHGASAEEAEGVSEREEELEEPLKAKRGSDLWRQRMSESLKRACALRAKAPKAKPAGAAKGSEEWRQKIREGMQRALAERGPRGPLSHEEKVAKRLFEPRTEEHKRKISAGLTKAFAEGRREPHEWSAEHRENVRQAVSEPRSEATRAKMSQAKREYWAARPAADRRRPKVLKRPNTSLALKASWAARKAYWPAPIPEGLKHLAREKAAEEERRRQRAEAAVRRERVERERVRVEAVTRKRELREQKRREKAERTAEVERLAQKRLNRVVRERAAAAAAKSLAQEVRTRVRPSPHPEVRVPKRRGRPPGSKQPAVEVGDMLEVAIAALGPLKAQVSSWMAAFQAEHGHPPSQMDAQEADPEVLRAFLKYNRLREFVRNARRE